LVKGKKKIDKSAHLYRLPNRHRTERDLIYWGKVAGLATLRFIRDKGNVVALSRSNWNLRGFILLSFFFGGMASLMDQVLWMRQLGLIFGTTMQAVSTVLAIFMAGLALGSFLFGRMADKSKNPLRLFALLQIGIGSYVMLTPLIFKALNATQVSIYGSLPVGSAGITILRILFAFLVLIVPTTLMGGTLPVIAKYFVRKRDELGGGLGNLYFINTLGAVLGAFLAGFFLIPYIGVLAATLLAASIDLTIGVVFYLLCRSRLKPKDEPMPVVQEEVVQEPALLAKKQLKRQERIHRKQERLKPEVYSRAIKIVVFVGFAFGGLAAISLEVSWTRVLSMILGSSIYAFSLMLTAFLLGIALGSAIVSKFVDRLRHLWVYFLAVQVLIGLAVLVLNPIFGELPLLFVRIFPNLQANFWLLQFVQFLLLLLIMLVPTLLMGAAFPIAARIYSDDMEHMGGSVGRLYAGNTFGSMVGPLIAGFIIIPLIGIQWSISLVSIIYLVIAGAVFIVGFKERLASSGADFINGCKQRLWWPYVTRAGRFISRKARVIPIIRGIVLLPVVLIWPLINPARTARAIASASFGLTVVILPALLVATILVPTLGSWNKKILNSGVFLYADNYQGAGDLAASISGSGQFVFYDEGLMATVAVYDEENGDRSLTVDGKVDATSFGDLPTELISGHLPMILHENPEEVLLIGLGSGITLGAVEQYPSLINVEAVEISNAVIESAKYFKEANHDALNNEKLTMIQADARNYVFAQGKTGKEYDVITAEPSNPWMAGNSILFTREQFELYKKVLADDGIICQWVHYYSMSPADLNTVIATFTDVFPNSTLWRTGGDLLLIGTKDKQSIDFVALNTRVQQPDISADLKRMDVDDVYGILGRFVMGPEALEAFSDGAPMHTDNNPILQFSAPKSLYNDTNLVNNAQSLQRAAQRIEDIDSLLINTDDDANFPEEIQKQRGFYIHYTSALVNGQKTNTSLAQGNIADANKYANATLAANEAILGTGARGAYINRHLGSQILDRGKEQGNLSFVEQAIPYLEQSIALNPTVVTTWVDLGEAYYISGQYQNAVESFSGALDLVKGNTFLYNLRGQTYQKLEEWDAAIEDFDQAIRLAPAFTDVWASRALAYMNFAFETENDEEKDARLDRALVDANQALQLDSRQAAAYYIRGRVYCELGEQTGNKRYYNLAISEQRKSISINSDSPYPYVYLGKAQAALGGEANLDVARKSFDLAVLKGKNQDGDVIYWEVSYEYGRFLFENVEELDLYFPIALDRTEAAVANMLRAYELAPKRAQYVLDAFDEFIDLENITKDDLEHLGTIHATLPDTDIAERIPVAVDEMLNWDHITEADRETLDEILLYLPITEVGQRALEALDVLDTAAAS
jgi:spermidine synthase